ncbi:MAG: histidine kinase [Acidimicrobiia bacterium]
MRSLPVRVMRTAAVVAMVLGIWPVVALLSIGGADIMFQLFVLHNALAAVVLGVIVWLVAPRQPENRVIWVLTVAAVACGIYASGISTPIWLGSLLYDFKLNPKSTTPVSIPRGLATITAFCDPFWILGLLSMSTFGLLLFPDGRLASPRWRIGAVLAGLGLVLAMSGDVWDMRPGGTRTYAEVSANPNPVLLTGLGLLLAAAVISMAAFITRYRHSEGQARQQFKWVGFATTLLAVLSFVAVALDPLSGTIVPALALVGFMLFLAAYGVAIAKYRLYDADLVINRTVVFAVLAGFITLVYMVVVVGIGWLPIFGSDSSLVLSVVATALVALVFEPVRLRAQRWANRLVYGNRASPYEVLSYLTSTLAATESLDGLLGRMAERLADGTGADRATVWLVDGGGLTVGAASADPPPPVRGIEELPGRVFQIADADEVLGAFSIEKKRGDSLSPTEERLARDLAGSAGMVLRNARLNTDLATRASELRESRRRLVDAQDVERRRLERAMHDGVEKTVASLEANVGVAQRVARDENTGKVPELLRQMAGHAREAIDQIRSLGKGIYPPQLESKGLAALDTIGEQFPGVGVDVADIGRLAPEIESAVWFAASEAVTNAVKHGAPPIRLEVSRDDDGIRLEVIDSGDGFDPSVAGSGSGLINMRDRLEALDGHLVIEAGADRGTRVLGAIPIPPAEEVPGSDGPAQQRESVGVGGV